MGRHHYGRAQSTHTGKPLRFLSGLLLTKAVTAWFSDSTVNVLLDEWPPALRGAAVSHSGSAHAKNAENADKHTLTVSLPSWMRPVSEPRQEVFTRAMIRNDTR